MSVPEIVRPRAQGLDNHRLDGVGDILWRCPGASVLDIGCNRGMVGYEMAQHGAVMVDGVDNYEEGITVARHIFSDMRHVTSRFVVADLSKGVKAFDAAMEGGAKHYDIVLALAVFHKLQRQMPNNEFDAMVTEFGKRARSYLVWRGAWEHLDKINGLLQAAGLEQAQWSRLSTNKETAAGIWRRRA